MVLILKAIVQCAHLGSDILVKNEVVTKGTDGAGDECQEQSDDSEGARRHHGSGFYITNPEALIG